MIARRSCVLLVALIALTQAGPAQAQFFRKIIHGIVQDTKRNNCWPNPFMDPDRQAVRAPIEMMVAAGWQRQNLLGDYHFDEQTDELTEAGKLKIRWIATQVPAQHRVLFVSEAPSAQQTALRIEAVRNAAAEFVHTGDLPQVLASNIDPGGWPASRVDAIGRKFESVMPDPKLPKVTEASGSP